MFGLSLSPNVISTSSTGTDVLQTVYNKNCFLYVAKIDHVHSKRHSWRLKMRAFISDNLPSDLKKEELKNNIKISSYNKMACTHNQHALFTSLCLSWLRLSTRCWNPLKVIMFIPEGVSKTCCVCLHDWDATDSCGYARISLWNSYIK